MPNEPITLPTLIKITFENGKAFLYSKLLGHGTSNAAYHSDVYKHLPVAKIPLHSLNPTHNTEDKDWVQSVNTTDSPERCARLWNTYILPRITAKLKELNPTLSLTELQEEFPEAKPAQLARADFTDTNSNKQSIQIWLPPFLDHEGDAIRDKEKTRCLLESYHGFPEFGILGGRLYADAVAKGNIIRWKGLLLPIDPGAFFTLTSKTEAEQSRRRTYSEISTQAWFSKNYPHYENSSEIALEREHDFRGWFCNLLFLAPNTTNSENPRYYHYKNWQAVLKNYKQTSCILSAALCFLARERPQYLDLFFLSTDEGRKALIACAWLFLTEHLQDPSIDETKKEFQKIVDTYFPRLSGLEMEAEADTLSYNNIMILYRPIANALAAAESLCGLYEFLFTLKMDEEQSLSQKKKNFLNQVPSYLTKLNNKCILKLYTAYESKRDVFHFIRMENSEARIGWIERTIFRNENPTGNTNTHEKFIGLLKAQVLKNLHSGDTSVTDLGRLNPLMQLTRGRLPNFFAKLGAGLQGEFQQFVRDSQKISSDEDNDCESPTPL